MAILDFNRLPPTSPIKVADGVGEWEWRFGLLAEQSMWGGLLNGSLGLNIGWLNHSRTTWELLVQICQASTHVLLQTSWWTVARNSLWTREMKLGSQRCFELDDTPKACNMLQEAEMTHDSWSDLWIPRSVIMLNLMPLSNPHNQRLTERLSNMEMLAHVACRGQPKIWVRWWYSRVKMNPANSRHQIHPFCFRKNPPKWHLPVRLIKLTDACLVHQDHLKDKTDMELDSSRGLGPSQPKPQTNMGYHGIRSPMTRDSVIQLDTDSFGMLLSHESIPEARLAGIAERIPRNKVGILADEGSWMFVKHNTQQFWKLNQVKSGYIRLKHHFFIVKSCEVSASCCFAWPVIRWGRSAPPLAWLLSWTGAEVKMKIWNTYENTIFSGMNIHFNPAMTWGEQKVPGFWPIPIWIPESWSGDMKKSEDTWLVIEFILSPCQVSTIIRIIIDIIIIIIMLL